MPNKSISFPIENTGDNCIAIGWLFYSPEKTCAWLVANSSAPDYWFDAYPGDPPSLCLEVADSGSPLPIGYFRRPNGETYNKQGLDFAGAHPKPRTQ